MKVILKLIVSDRNVDVRMTSLRSPIWDDAWERLPVEESTKARHLALGPRFQPHRTFKSQHTPQKFAREAKHIPFSQSKSASSTPSLTLLSSANSLRRPGQTALIRPRCTRRAPRFRPVSSSLFPM